MHMNTKENREKNNRINIIKYGLKCFFIIGQTWRITEKY